MSALNHFAANVVRAIFDSKSAMRYLINGPEQEASFDLFVDSEYIIDQMNTLASLPELIDEPANALTMYRILSNDMSATVDPDDKQAMHEIGFLETVLDKFHQAMAQIASSQHSEKQCWADTLNVIAATFGSINNMPQPINPLVLYLLCLQSGLPIPMLSDWSVFNTGASYEKTDALERGMRLTQQLMGGEPVIATQERFFEHRPDTHTTLSGVCASHGSRLKKTYKAFNPHAKTLFLTAAETGDVTSAMALIEELQFNLDFYQLKLQALIEAAKYGHIEFIQLILEQSDIDLIDSYFNGGKTVLLTAAEFDQEETVNFLLARNANPYIQHEGITVFNYALQYAMNDMSMAISMIRKHLENPSVQLGAIEPITDEDIQRIIKKELLFPAITTNDIAMLAFIVENHLIFDQQTYAEMIHLIATDSDLSIEQKLLQLELLPDRMDVLLKAELFVSSLSIEEALQVCHQQMMHPLSNDTAFETLAPITYYCLQSILQNGTPHDFERYLDATLVRTSAPYIPEKYKMMLASGQMRALDPHILYQLRFDEGMEEFFSAYLDVILHSPLLTTPQKMQLVAANEKPTESRVFIYNLMNDDHVDLYGIYLRAILNSPLSVKEKTILITPTGVDTHSAMAELLTNGSSRLIATFTEAVCSSNLTASDKWNLLNPPGCKKGFSAIETLFAGAEVEQARQIAEEKHHIKYNAEQALLEAEHSLEDAVQARSDEETDTFHVEREAQKAEEKFVECERLATEATEDAAQADQNTRTEEQVITQLVRQFVTDALNDDSLTTDQKYRLIWPKGSSKKHGLHELFKPGANNSAKACAYLSAMLTSPLDKTIKEKILRKLTPHVPLPIVAGETNIHNLPLELSMLGHRFKADHSFSLVCHKITAEDEITLNLSNLLTNTSFETDTDRLREQLSDLVRNIYLDPRLEGKRNTNFTRALAELAASYQINLTAIGEDDYDSSTVITTVLTDPQAHSSKPIAIKPQRPLHYIDVISSSVEAGLMSRVPGGGTSWASSVTASSSWATTFSGPRSVPADAAYMHKPAPVLADDETAVLLSTAAPAAPAAV